MVANEKLNSFLFALFGFGKARSKAHILLIILIHATGWCIFLMLPLLFYPVKINNNRIFLRELVDKLFLVAFFYFNYYFLIPRFFSKKKVWIYFSSVLLCYIVYFSQNVFVRYQYGLLPREAGRVLKVLPPLAAGDKPPLVFRAITPEGVLSSDTADVLLPRFTPAIREPVFMGVPRGIAFLSLNNTLSSFCLLLLMGGFIRLTFSFIRNQNEKKILENANLNAEVSFLKSQINPHFLFNTLNGIYSLANARSPHVEKAILELSQMFRYVLYESGTEKIELHKDIAYITNYINLQRLRLAQKVQINYKVTGETKSLYIAPLLLISFIENAFKHGVSYVHPSTISVEISIFDETLTLVVSNTIFEKKKFESGGIGLKNTLRRLELIYPGKYLLDMVTHNHLYVVNLKINLQSD
jgi:two-component system LytT family sensor kinase